MKFYHDVQHYYSLASPDKKPSSLKVFFGFFSPRMVPIGLIRLSHYMVKIRLAPIGKLIGLFNFVIFGLEVGSYCKIGTGIFFPHTSGIVIGADSIGNNVTIYQGVTLGAKDLDFNNDSTKRPTIGDNVVIASGAKVLGGITIGHGSIIAANAVVLHSVPDNVLVGGIPAKIIKTLS